MPRNTLAPHTRPTGPSVPYHDQPQPVAPQYQTRDSSAWLNPPSRPSASWSPEDDAKLISARQQGMNWQVVSTRIFPGKTPNACRKRHERLMERSNAEEWDGVKLELLAKEYMDVRQEMWSVLGDRLNEKWNLIEAKCMEKGIKNLAAAARSANRRSIGTDDSGIAMDDAERSLTRHQDDKYLSVTSDAYHATASTNYPRPTSHGAMSAVVPTQHIMHTSRQQHPHPQPHQRPPPHHHQRSHSQQHHYSAMSAHMSHPQMYHHVQAPSIASIVHPHMPPGPH